MTLMLLIANIAVFFSALIGMLCIANKNKWGFVIFILAELSLAYIGYSTKSYGLIFTAGMYACMNVYSWIKWTNEKIKR
tara:strand:- start:221 stop:457 length:237 start_codon:yes stop_codon:yes gene_type:complete